MIGHNTLIAPFSILPLQQGTSQFTIALIYLFSVQENDDGFSLHCEYEDEHEFGKLKLLK